MPEIKCNVVANIAKDSTMSNIAIDLTNDLSLIDCDILRYCNIQCDDNVASSICVRCSFDDEEDWTYHIYENSRFFTFMISSIGRKYTEGEKVCVQLIVSSHKIDRPTFRKYTGTPKKCIEKIVSWIENTYR